MMMEYKECHAEVHYSDEDRLFIGHVTGSTDSLGFHGSTLTEVTDVFHQSIENYSDYCIDIEKPIL